MQRLIPILFCVIFFFGCRTVPPSVIGSETREQINTLELQTEKSASRAEILDLSIDVVKDDVNAFETKIPDELKPEYHKIQTKITLLAGLTETHKTETVEVAKKSVDVYASFEKSMKEAAVAVQEKNDAKLREQKANNRSLVLVGIIGIMILCTGGYLTLKYYFHLPI